MLSGLIILILVCTASVSASAQTLRFLASPCKVKEGDAVTFQYLDQKPDVLNRTNVSGWTWTSNSMRRLQC